MRQFQTLRNTILSRESPKFAKEEMVYSEGDAVLARYPMRWGEPSYIAKGGSTVRVAWKKPCQIAMRYHALKRMPLLGA